MTPREELIMEDLSSAETYPGSRKLNWREIPLHTVIAWATLPGRIKGVFDYDMVSIRWMIEEWWRKRKNEL